MFLLIFILENDKTINKEKQSYNGLFWNTFIQKCYHSTGFYLWKWPYGHMKPSWKKENPISKSKVLELEKNKAGYTAVRCVPRYICTRPVLRCPSFITPFHAPSSHLITSLCNPQPLVVPTVEKTRFRAIKKKGLRTDGQTNGRMDGRTDRPSYKGAWTHLKNLS